MSHTITAAELAQLREALESIVGVTMIPYNGGVRYGLKPHQYELCVNSLPILSEIEARTSEPVAAREVSLEVIRKWPDGFQDRLQQVWLDVVSFIPNVKLYDLQRVLAEFGFTMKVYDGTVSAASVPDGYIVQEETEDGLDYGYYAPYPEAVHEHINEQIQRCVDAGIEVPVMHCVAFYLTPQPAAVPKEST